MKRVAIIGAGMAGLAAAQRLGRHGFDVTLFEKIRGLGGRMATRRVGDLQFDHGAQYFTAKGLRFSETVETWRSHGHVAEWFGGGFVGSPEMSAPARAMAQDHSVVAGCHVGAIKKDGLGWSIYAEDGLVETPKNGSYSAVVLAVPGPQAAPLAASAGVDLPALAVVRYAPCWALILGFSAPISLTEDWTRPQDDAIGWFARNGSKPGRKSDTETIVVHATPEWSRKHLEWSPAAVVGELAARWQFLTGVHEQPCFSAAHRWRYALVEETAGVPFLWDDDLGLGACGDWCLGPKVEAAFDSGLAVAESILQTQGADLVV